MLAFISSFFITHLSALAPQQPVSVPQKTIKEAKENDKAYNPDELPDIVLGSPDAKVTLIEYSSINCSHCASFHTDDFPKLKKQLIDTGKVRFIYRHFPLDGQAVLAMGVIALAPQEQWFDKICIAYEKMNQWINEGPLKLAQVCGITNQACKDIKNQTALVDRIMAKRYNAERQYDIPYTPFFIVVRNGKQEILTGELTLEILMDKLK